MYGLSCVPDIAQLPVDSSCRCLVLASDGLWDTCGAELAVVEAMAAYRQGRSPADHLGKEGSSWLTV